MGGAGWLTTRSSTPSWPPSTCCTTSPGARSSIDEFAVGEGREVGPAVVFDPVVDGRRYTFRASGVDVVDVETGSTWDVVGRAVRGPAQGARLTAVPAVSAFWFGWVGFHEDTRVLTDEPRPLLR